MNLSSSSKKLIIRVSLFLLYLLLGAAIFMLIEQSKEIKERAKAKEFVALRKNFTNASKTSEDVKKFLLDLEHALRYGYDINKDDLNGAKWSFTNSFYFVGNIVTTIGKLISNILCFKYLFFSLWSKRYRVFWLALVENGSLPAWQRE